MTNMIDLKVVDNLKIKKMNQYFKKDSLSRYHQNQSGNGYLSHYSYYFINNNKKKYFYKRRCFLYQSDEHLI